MTLINYHVAEWLMCRYPRLPMTILYSAMNGYAGSRSLHKVAQSWGVESAAAPGEEVDPGLLQFSLDADRVQIKKWGYVRPEAQNLDKYRWRRGLASRVVMDDDFGDQVASSLAEDNIPGSEDQLAEDRRLTLGNADEKMQIAFDVHASFVRAVVGAIYGHCGREAAKSFVRAHILSRQLDVSSLFWFEKPTGELAKLCAREEFEKPVARLLSETGRLSRTPVFVVGIFSGQDKLGEGAASSLEAARTKAAINALKAWYLYSPGENVRVPSDMLLEGAKPWEPVHVDIGEII
ncbi:putative 60s ribosomal protein l3 protein [Phaeoacremonium minimum UCRPA7]|uniref:Large ribosomal subunit protein mL44 n=1 Tax=Phaeoacremonium minimum (strain UCR-PA7) TaxID=1286976 RepID=R8BX71_PHAM7|nr:putative 60s ribosomal protein l3 protein [Phaeoacremonium minimum UCRPA7]EOO03879.1 putative 60s ribosomal protein l3 protein [Phaeoacremonium minimum UCRPA7]